MITIRIGTETRDIATAEERWINKLVGGGGHQICIEIIINEPGVDMVLRTPQCGNSGGGGGRRANAQEQHIFDLWQKAHLNNTTFSGGNVNSFVKRLSSLLK